MSGEGWAWQDGRVMPLAQASVALTDRGYLLGDGLFETLRARRGRVLAWPPHAARLRRGLAVLQIDSGAAEVAREAVFAVSSRAAAMLPGDAYVRVQVVRENPECASAPGVVTALARALPESAQSLRRSGVRLGVVPWRRDLRDPLLGVKPLSYLPHLMARRAAQSAGWDDGLVLNSAERVCEAAFGNVIACGGTTLYAPGLAEGALDGVTRHLLLQEAAQCGYRVSETLSVRALEEAQEAVLVSTLAGVVPIIEVEGVKASFAGAGGSFAQMLADAYERLLAAGTK